MISIKSMLSAALASAMVATVPAVAETTYKHAKSPADATWVTMSGEVTEVDANFFTIDYGDGYVIVEASDRVFDKDTFQSLDGQKVTVTGKVEKGLFSDTALEAKSIFVEGLNTTFVANDVTQEEADRFITTAYVPRDLSQMNLVGNVTAVSDESFQMDVEDMTITVSTEDLSSNPLDDRGYLKIENGDRIKVTANVEPDFFGNYTVDAETIIKLNNNSA